MVAAAKAGAWLLISKTLGSRFRGNDAHMKSPPRKRGPGFLKILGSRFRGTDN
jgi:hypothetical protein